LQAAGTALGSQVTRIANSGGRVLISTLPDVGLTPFAISEEAATPGRAAMLSRLSKVFNAYLRNGFIDDGRRIGLLLTDELFANVVKSPAGAGLVDVKHAWCDPAFPPPACTTNTPVPPPSAAASAPASTYLWAGDLLFGSSGHSLLGNQAVSRANSNPF
jgi:phospholipase/lecithinase/hemolysin